MAATGKPQSSSAQAWIGVLCALVVIIPYYGLAILSGIAVQREGIHELPPLRDTLIQALLVTGIFCGLTWLMLRHVLKESVASLSRPGTPLVIDLLHAVNISMLLLLGQFVVGMATGVTAGAESGFNMLLGQQLNAEPLAFLVWAGPVAWLQAALTEEFTRAFILSRFWRMWPGNAAMFVSLVVMSFLFGCGHYYQGAPAVLGTFFIGLVFGFHYMRFRSLRAIILGHGIYDMLVMLFLMLGARYAA